MKRKDSEYAIYCDSFLGPAFGSSMNNDLMIVDHCNEENKCYFHNNGKGSYECHPEYKSSLFVNTAGLNEENKFSVLDYEVFSIDYEDKDNVNKLCKHPDIIWNYIKSKDISEDSLQQFDDDTELLNDLDTIHCEDSDIRLKISRYIKNLSELLSDTHFVDQQYDSYLREWLGDDYKWKLLYRAS